MTTSERWRQIDDLYHAALEQDANQRAAFVDQTCGSDAELRQEVLSLIASHEQAGDFIADPAFKVAARALARDRAESFVGRTLGHYQILAALGTGGMGEVYLAEDKRLGRRVALKLLPAYFKEDSERLRRFEQEARSASALNHPNIITIYDIADTDLTPFIATELIEGETLREHMLNRVMKLDEVLDIATQVAAALAAAHEVGVVHRDIKPENIMLRSRDRIVKVLDFGVAKLGPLPDRVLSAEPLTHVTVQTQPGLVMGTLQYMSPEQARGLEVDARTDLWSLGVVLYEMITRRIPFTGDSPADLTHSILEMEPPPLASYGEVHTELTRIIGKALFKDRRARYQTAEEMALDLERLAQELDAEARFKEKPQPRAITDRSQPADTADRSAGTAAVLKPMHMVDEAKHRKRAVALVAAVIVALSVIASAFFGGRGIDSIDSIAILPFTSVRDDPNSQYLSDGITESIIHSISRLPALRVMSFDTMMRYKQTQMDPRAVGRELKVEAVLVSGLLQSGDDLVISCELIDVTDGGRLWGKQYTRKLSEILAVQDDIAQDISKSLRLGRTGEQAKELEKRYTDNAEAYQLYLKGRYFWNKRTEDGFRRGIEHFSQAVGKDPKYALAYAGLADSYIGLTFYNFGAPDDTMRKAKEAALNALSIDDRLAEAHASLAHILVNYDRNWSAAEKEFKRSIELDPDYPTAHQWYAIHYLTAMGRWDQALPEMKRALGLEPASLVMNTFMCEVLYYSGRYDEAIEQCRNTLDMDPNFAVAHWHLGLAYDQKGMFDDAIAEFQKATTLSGGSPLMKAALGYGYARANKTREARTILKELKELSKNKYVSSYEVAAIYVALGETEQAFQLLEEAYHENSFHLVYINVWPQFRSLKSDPRFERLVKRLGLSGIKPPGTEQVRLRSSMLETLLSISERQHL